MLLTYKRTDLIEKLEAKRTELAKGEAGQQEKLQKAAIAELKEQIENLQGRLKRVQEGKLRSDEHVNTDLGTYGNGRYYRQNDTSALDALIAQLKLATDEKILTQGIKATARLAFEASIAVVEELEGGGKLTYLDRNQWLAYQDGLADVKSKLQNLLAEFAE